jgi:hypothetical protein
MTPSVEGTKRRPESETPCFDAGMRKFPPVSVHMQPRHDPDYRPVPEDWRGNGWGRKTELSHFHFQRWNAIAEIREFDHALTIIAMDKKAGTKTHRHFSTASGPSLPFSHYISRLQSL